MSKKARERQLADNEAQAVARVLRTSPRKLNLVCQSIRGRSAEKALAELTFSKRRIARDVKKTLQSAIANAENNHQSRACRQDWRGTVFTPAAASGASSNPGAA